MIFHLILQLYTVLKDVSIEIFIIYWVFLFHVVTTSYN